MQYEIVISKLMETIHAATMQAQSPDETPV